MNKVNYFLAKCLFVFNFLFCIYSVFSNPSFNEGDKYLLSLFEGEDSFSQSLVALKEKESEKNKYYLTMVLLNLYDYCVISKKIKPIKSLNNQLIADFFNDFSEKSQYIKGDSKFVFDKYIRENPRFCDISFDVFEVLQNEFQFIQGSYLIHLLERARDSGYSKKNKIQSTDLQTMSFVNYDFQGNKVNSSGILYTVPISELMQHGSYFVLKLKDKTNIKFDVSSYKKNDLKKIHALYEDLRLYSELHPKLHLTVSFEDDILREEIILGKDSMVNFVDIESCINNSKYNILTIGSSVNYNTIFRFTDKEKRNLFVIELPESINIEWVREKRKSELIDALGSEIALNDKIAYKIVKKENNQRNEKRIFFLRASESPVYDRTNLILEREGKLIKKTIKWSSVLEKFIENSENYIQKIEKKINNTEDFRSVFLDHLFTDLILLINNIKNWNGDSILLNAYDISNILDGLVIKLKNKTELSGIDDKNIFEISNDFIKRLILKLNDINVEKGRYIIFEYLHVNKKIIMAEYIDKKEEMFVLCNNVGEKLKLCISNRVEKKINIDKNMTGSQIIQIRKEIDNAYNDIFYHGLFSDEQLIEQVYEIYLINKSSESFAKKNQLKNKLRIRYLSMVPQEDLKNYIQFSENKPPLILLKEKKLLSDYEANGLLGEYIGYENKVIEELRYSLKDEYAKDECLAKKILAAFIRDNKGEFGNNKNRNYFTLRRMIPQSNTNVRLYFDSNNIFNSIIQPYLESNKLKEFFKQWEDAKSKEVNNKVNTSIPITFISYSEINENDEKRAPTIIKEEFKKILDVFDQTDGSGIIQLVSASGQAGIGKSSFFPYQIRLILEAKRAKGIDINNIYCVKLGQIGSSYVSGGLIQMHEFFDKIEIFIKKHPESEIYVLGDEVSQWLHLKEDFDENGRIKEGNSKLDIERAFCDRYEQLMQKRVVFMFTDNRDLEKGLSPQVKTRLAKGMKIVNIKNIELGVLRAVLQGQLAERNIHNLNFSNNNLELIRHIVGNNQRNDNIIKQIVYCFSNKFTNENDKNIENFMHIVNSFGRNNQRQKEKEYLGEYQSIKYTKNVEEKSNIDISGVVSAVAKQANLPEPVQSVGASILGKCYSLNIFSGAAVSTACWWLFNKGPFMKRNEDESGNKQQLWPIFFGPVLSGLPSLFISYLYSGETFKDFFKDLSNWNEAYGIDPAYRNNSKIAKPVRSYQSIEKLSELKSEDYMKLLQREHFEQWRYSNEKNYNLGYLFETYLKELDLVYYSDFPEDEKIRNMAFEEFNNDIIKVNDRKFLEFKLYINKKCPKLKKIIEKIGLRDYVHLLNADAVETILFQSLFNGEINNQLDIDELENTCEEYFRTHNIMQRYVNYVNNAEALKKKQNLNNFSLQLETENQHTQLADLIRSWVIEIKHKRIPDKVEKFDSFWMKPNFRQIFLKDYMRAKNRDAEFSALVTLDSMQKETKQQSDDSTQKSDDSTERTTDDEDDEDDE